MPQQKGSAVCFEKSMRDMGEESAGLCIQKVAQSQAKHSEVGTGEAPIHGWIGLGHHGPQVPRRLRSMKSKGAYMREP